MHSTLEFTTGESGLTWIYIWLKIVEYLPCVSETKHWIFQNLRIKKRPVWLLSPLCTHMCTQWLYVVFLQIQQGNCIFQTRAAVTACTSPSQAQARQKSTTEWGGTMNSQPWLRNYRQLTSPGNGIVRFLKVCSPLVGGPYSSGSPQIQESMQYLLHWIF